MIFFGFYGGMKWLNDFSKNGVLFGFELYWIVGGESYEVLIVCDNGVLCLFFF